MADWTKAQLLADIANMYIGVGTPENPGAEGAINGVTKYIVNVNETGLSQANKKPTGYRKNVVFYVFHEGQGDEKAWYEIDEPKNTSQGDITAGDSSYYSYTRIYSSIELRTRVLGKLIQAADYFIKQEAPLQKFHWAQQFVKDPDYFIDAFMVEMAADNTVRADGNATSDNDLSYVIEAIIPYIATAYEIS